MPKLARAIGEPEIANQPAANAAAARNLSPRPRATKSSSKRTEAKPVSSNLANSPSPLEGQTSTLLVGAGIGAALTLSIVALRAKQPQPTFTLFSGKKSTLASALIKTAVFAIARASTRGSLTNL